MRFSTIWGRLRFHARVTTMLYRDTSLIRNSPPPWDHHFALSIVLLQGPRGAVFLMSEVLM